LAVDYSDFESHCKILLDNESELIKKEVEDGELTEAEAAEDFDYSLELGQCVCFYQKVLAGGGADFISYFQKLDIIQMDDDYTVEDVQKLEVPKVSDRLDIEAIVSDSVKACGMDTE